MAPSLALTAGAFSPPDVPPARRLAAEIDGPTLEACRRHDPAALRCFVLRYEGLVFAFLSRALARRGAAEGRHQVEDLAQEVFLKAHRALPQFTPRAEARVSTWLLTIASRIVLDHHKRKRLDTIPLEGHEPVKQAPSPESERRGRELAQTFARAAARLSDEQRVVLVLAQFHGLPMAEIAAMLAVSENTVRTRLHRARERMRALLAEAGEG